MEEHQTAAHSRPCKEAGADSVALTMHYDVKIAEDESLRRITILSARGTRSLLSPRQELYQARDSHLLVHHT
jgi:hypothetical protein